jgi:type IV pilus assembly protein PilM
LILKRSKSRVAVDIGSGVLKVVEVDHAASPRRVVKLGATPLPEGAIVDGEVMDHGAVVSALRSLWGALGISERHVSTAVSGRDVIVKKITMDRMKEQEAREVIRWEAEQHVPFDMESVNLDFQILDPEGDGLEMSVLLVAAKRELVEARTALLQDAGLQPLRIDVDAFAVQSAFEANYAPAPDAVYALVNVGHEITNVNLVQGTDPILTRDLPVGANRFVDALQKNLGLSREEAVGSLRGEAPAGPPADQVRSTLAEIGQEITAGVDRARAFLSSGAGGSMEGSLRGVYLSGGCASVPGLAESLGRSLAVPVEQLDPFRRVPVDEAMLGPDDRRELAPLLALAVGLALED